jgi:predicted MFS family arabinose efflux permease
MNGGAVESRFALRKGRETMQPTTLSEPAELNSVKENWWAVLSIALGVFGLVTAEFLPAGLLTPISEGLHVTEGVAGQAITTTAAIGAIMGLLAPTLTRRIDRRVVMLAFSILVIASDLLVAFATNIIQLFIGRVLLGIALGGFWTMSTATIMRLVPQRLMPRALAIVYSGISAATVLAIPFGSYVGNQTSWRIVFLIAAGFSVLALIVQLATLPRIEPRGYNQLRTLFDVLALPKFGLGLLAIILIFSGHFLFFTYIRPFLEGTTRVSIDTMSAILLGFGVASFLGTYLGGFLVEISVRLALVVMPLTMGILGLLLAGFGGTPLLDAALVAMWGLAFGAVPVVWITWATRLIPNEAESANGLIVAAIGVATAMGAGIGGIIFDDRGMTGVFVASSISLLAAVLLTLLAGFGLKKSEGRTSAG